jgi:hypothetical protein
VGLVQQRIANTHPGEFGNNLSIGGCGCHYSPPGRTKAGFSFKDSIA